MDLCVEDSCRDEELDRDMWVRTTLRIERWTKEKTEDDTSSWDESSTGKEGLLTGN